MYCVNYDYYEIGKQNYICLPIVECSICLEIKLETCNNEYPIQLQKTEYYKMCACNIWIHSECLDSWYNIHYNCPICKQIMYKTIIHPIINNIVIIRILSVMRLLFISAFWYNIIFTIHFIIWLPFT